MKEYLYKTKGFTYIELLIVVGVMIIFGVFFVVAVDPVGKIKAQRDSQRESDLNNILLSVQQKVKNDRGWNCPSGPLPQDKFTAIGTGPGMYDLYNCLTPHYLSKYLVDPKEGNPSSGRNITDGLVGHWKFDEGSGTTAYDSSGNDNHGTLINGPTWVDGKMDRALKFNGTNNEVVVSANPSIANIFDGGGVASVWIKPDITSSGTRVILNKWLGIYFVLRDIDNGKANIELQYNFTGGWGGFRSINQDVVLGEWSHLALLYNTDSTTNVPLFYVNGVSIDIDPFKIPAGTRSSDASTNFQIGKYSTVTSSIFNGLIDDVRIYNRALSADEIQDLYNYEYSSKYAIWQNPVTKNISLKSIEDETKEVSTGAPEIALDFDGTNDWISVLDSSSLNFNEEVTISSWIKTTNPEDNQGYIAAKLTGGWGWNTGYGLTSYWAGFILARGGSSGTNYVDTGSNTSYWDGDWHHVVGTGKSNDKVKLYVDGIIDREKNFPYSMTVNSANLIIGGQPGWALFGGKLKDVRIYNRALSAEEVEQLYKGYDIRNGLVGHWPLNEAEGETAYDRSGNDNHGTLLPAGDGPTWTTK